MTDVHWLDQPEHHDYKAAADYLSLVAEWPIASHVAKKLEKFPDVIWYKAKDILRAANVGVLPASNTHVAKDLAKIAQHEPLSPILLVRGDATNQIPLTIADGYHRVCASWLHDENTSVPCHIVSWDGKN